MSIIPKTEQKVQFALKYAGIGWRVLPLYGKNPLIKEWPKLATTDPETIKDWWKKWPYANIGVATGGGSGVIVLDVDPKNGGIDSLNQLIEKHGSLPETVTAVTGSGGYHYFFKAPEWWVKNGVEELGAGLDIRGDGGQIVVHPSIHPVTKRVYQWLKSPFEMEPAELPEWLKEFLRKNNHKATEQARKKYKGRVWEEYVEGPLIQDGIHEGTRNSTLTSIAGSMRARGASFEDILVTLLEINRLHCKPPEDESVVRRIAESVSRYEQGKKTGGAKNYALTDVGNAERFADRHGADVKYTKAFGFMVYDSTRWISDETGEVLRRAIDTARSIKEQAAQIKEFTEAHLEYKKELERFAKASESKNKLQSMLEIAKAMPGIAATPDQFDNKPWLLNLKNGTLNLRTMEFRKHRREDMITKIAPVAYDPESDCPRWKQFLQEIFNGDEELIDFIQRAVGYTLTGDTSEQVMFILYGSGKNGKSTFLNTLHALLGDYAQQGANHLLTMKAWGESGGASSEVARLKGARFVTVIETGEGARLNEPLVKQLTGGDPILARHLYKEPFEFKTEAKFWMATNHKPLIRGSDDGIWRRIRLIPFEIQIPPEKQDKHLDEKLLAELPGILNWCLEGLRKWLESGLPENAKVNAATRAYREEMDALGQFIEDCCVIDKKATVAISDLYRAYVEWCEENGEPPMKQRMLTKRLKERGFEQDRKNNLRFWVGIGLVTQSPYTTPTIVERTYNEAAATRAGQELVPSQMEEGAF